MFWRFNIKFNLVLYTCLAKYGEKEYFPGPEDSLEVFDIWNIRIRVKGGFNFRPKWQQQQQWNRDTQLEWYHARTTQGICSSKFFCAQNSTTCLISDKRKIFVYIHHSLKAMSHFYHNGHTQLLDVCLLCILRMNKRFIRGDLMCHDGIFLEKRIFLYMTLHA